MKLFKFRAWHYDAVEMLYEDLPGDVFRWKNEGQPVVIEQFTGLHDKNGAEIYEGDIVEGPHDYGPGGFKTQKGLVQFHETLGYQWNYWDFDKLEIIGNIHENPELLTCLE